MEKGKVVSLEDRVPKLKEHRRQKSNRRLIGFLSVFFILILLVIYFQSPLSKVSSIEVKGNSTISDEEIISLSGITKKTGFFSIEDSEVREALSDFDQIQDVRIEKELPNKVTIAVNEFQKVAYVVKGDKFSPILENGRTLDPVTGAFPDDAPLLMNWKNAEEIEEMALELMSLPDSISNAISEIYHTPEQMDRWHITLYMNDGYEVQASVRGFSEKMKNYPSIVSQLEPGAKGVIHMEVGTYFESFDKSGETDLSTPAEGAADETEAEATEQNENENEG